MGSLALTNKVRVWNRQISNKFIKHPSEILKVGDVVEVMILSVDLKKQQIKLTMKGIKK